MSRVDTIRKQHPELDVNIIDVIAKSDPSKTNKYITFLMGQIKEDFNPDSLVDRLFGGDNIKLLREFEKHSSARRIANSDITTYKSWDEIKKAVTIAESIVNRKKAEKDIIKLYENNEVLFLIPLTWEASKIFGYGTKWCTTNKNYFTSHANDGWLIYIITPQGKYAIYVRNDGDITCYDEKDCTVSIFSIPGGIPKVVQEKINQIIEFKIPQSNLKTLDILYPNQWDQGCAVYKITDFNKSDLREMFNLYSGLKQSEYRDLVIKEIEKRWVEKKYIGKLKGGGELRSTTNFNKELVKKTKYLENLEKLKKNLAS